MPHGVVPSQPLEAEGVQKDVNKDGWIMIQKNWWRFFLCHVSAREGICISRCLVNLFKMMSAGTKAKNSPWTYVSQNLRWILMGRIVSIPTISTGHESCKNCWHAENKGWIDMKKIKKFVISQLSANMKIIIIIIIIIINIINKTLAGTLV